jgi:hypothetical protein
MMPDIPCATISKLFPIRSRLAETGHRRVDHAGIQRADRVVIDPEFFRYARTKVFGDDVCFRSDLHEGFLAARVLHIEADALLVAIEHRETVRLAVHFRVEPARSVAFRKILDLDHFCAHVAEHHGAVRPAMTLVRSSTRTPSSGSAMLFTPVEWPESPGMEFGSRQDFSRMRHRRPRAQPNSRCIQGPTALITQPAPPQVRVDSIEA